VNELPIKLLTGIVTAVGVIFAVFFFMDERHANFDEVQELKRYTTFAVKELELEAVTSKLESFLAMPIEDRKDWHTREIERLGLHIKLMQKRMEHDEFK